MVILENYLIQQLSYLNKLYEIHEDYEVKQPYKLHIMGDNNILNTEL